MALRFIIIIDVKGQPPVDQIVAAFQAAEKLIRKVPGVQNLQSGPDLNPNAEKRQWAFTIDFDDRETMEKAVSHEDYKGAVSLLGRLYTTGKNATIQI